ncbi:hypothetical protein ABIE26_002708 [Pedobacter africanus]|uniref:Uncharacterized protein n=1 Tax=Pedobacter africanus TaxID=151894 RepID=A0ACC6KXR9_9SPHI|nr:DUF4302 domain-containing protein [Pedobacter africanus]MDR6783903.1 hypothetical protein [Pedobacter africanus]
MMKKILFIALVITGFIAGCKRDTDPIFDDPDTRLAAELTKDQAALLSSADGWKATIYPKGGKGFSYYFKFTADGKVTMLSDFNTTAATVPVQSTYRLKALQRPTLIFDTYNYIHLAADPDAAISGGSTGTATGLASDFEFAFTEFAGDTVKFEGTFNKNPMKMIKLSAAEAQSILAGGLKTMVDANAAYVSANKNPYIPFPDGVKGAIAIDANVKTVKLNYVDSKEVSQAQSTTFAFGINKIYLNKPLTYGSLAITEMTWDPAAKTYYIMAGTTRINLLNSPTPITPLTLMFGFPSNFTYRKITIPSSGLPTGVTSGFNTVYSTMVNLFFTSSSTTPRIVNTLTWTLTSNNTLTVEINYNSGSSVFLASASFTYARVGDTFTLSAPIYNGNWTTRTRETSGLQAYLLSGPFKIDWVTTTNINNTSTLGGFYRVADPGSFFYGIM